MTFMDSVGDSFKGCLEKVPVPFDQDSSTKLTFVYLHTEGEFVSRT